MLMIAVILSSITNSSPIVAQSDPIQPLEPITAENANRLTEILRIGRGIVTGDVAISPDGSTLAVASSIGVWLYDFNALEAEPSLLEGHRSRVWGVAFSPDGTRIASASGEYPEANYTTGLADNTVRVWDVDTGEQLVVLEGHTDTVLGVAYSPDGMHIASGSNDGTIRVWDAGTGESLAVLSGHNNRVRSITYSPDGTRITSGALSRGAGVGCGHGVNHWRY